MDERTQKLVELLRRIHTAPRMYFWASDEPFAAVRNIVNGYCSALRDKSDSQYIDFLDPCGNFAEWLTKDKGLSGDRNVGWMGKIHLSYPNEQERFEAFFSLLEEYIATRTP
jgi:hypothetical protein